MPPKVRARTLLDTTRAIQAALRRVLDKARTGARLGLDLLFPPRCAYCEELLAEGAPEPWLCEHCRHLLAPPGYETCSRCGLRTGGSESGARCAACKRRPMRFDRLIALGDYHEELRDAVLRMKRMEGEPLANAIAGLLWQTRSNELMELKVDAVMPIAMHWLRRIARGTNSPELVASRLARELNVPVTPRLRRRRLTRPQGNLSRAKRASNVRGAFVLRRAADCLGARVLLVDDVVTSGATCNEVARLLKRNGASFVAVATICRTQAPTI